jgi:hypothetical protein
MPVVLPNINQQTDNPCGAPQYKTANLLTMPVVLPNINQQIDNTCGAPQYKPAN